MPPRYIRTEYGVGQLTERGELRTAASLIVPPLGDFVYRRPATPEEIEAFHAQRRHLDAEMCRYYDSHKETGD